MPSFDGLWDSVPHAVDSSQALAQRLPFAARVFLAVLLVLLLAAVGITLFAPDLARALGLGWSGPVVPRATLWPGPTEAGSLVTSSNDLPGDSVEGRRGFGAKGAYSLCVDLLLEDPRKAMTVDKAGQRPFRHVLHRGSGEELALFTAGQPPLANPAVLLDPVRPDLLVRVDSVALPHAVPNSVRVEDVPVGRPFRLGLVVAGRRLDVYLDGRLRSTTLLQGLPIPLKGADDEKSMWHGLVRGIEASMRVQNLVLWDGAVGPAEMAAAARKPPDFGGVGGGGGTCRA